MKQAHFSISSRPSRLGRWLTGLALLVGWIGVVWVSAGCNAEQMTSRLVTWEGPSTKHGRMSASLGGVLLRDGRVVVVGGSPSESPFAPLTGKEAIEIADRSCILAPECRKAKSQCKCWRTSGIDLQHGIGGIVYQLPDGRLLAFSSIYVFDRESDRLDPKPPDDNTPTSGSVAAVIIDLKTKQVTPIYRPKNNELGQPSIKKGDSVALMQRAFERSLQLRDGRIVRIGGHVIYQDDPPSRSCDNNICHYCVGSECQPSDPGIACKPATVKEDCPLKKGTSKFTVLDAIEIYTPPDAKHPKGSVKVLRMDAARSSVNAIEMPSGKILIVGGWGPKGEGSNENYNSTYYLDPDKDGQDAIRTGPNTLFYREDHAMAVLKNGRILVTGGTDLNGVTINTSEYYDPDKGIFVYAPQMTIAREDHVPVPIGPWYLFVGGEDQGQTDVIRNSVEIFHATNGNYIGPKFLFAAADRNESLTGVTDFAAISLNANTVIVVGGQQGRQNSEGEYISSGKGSPRTLLFQYQEPR